MVAVILFIFIYRRRKARKATSTYGAPALTPSMAQSTPPPGGPPVMYGPPGAAGVDPRNSMMKYGPDATTQTPRESYYGSPPQTQPGSPGPGYGYPPPMGGQFTQAPAPTGSPAPYNASQGQSPPGQHSPWQPPPQASPPGQWHPPPGQPHGAPASELPLTRGDPQLREMQ